MRAVTISIEDIDDDLRERLERLRQQSGVSFDQVANYAIRIGLELLEMPPIRPAPFKTRAFNAGEPLFSSPEELKKLIAQIDEEEDLRKLGLM